MKISAVVLAAGKGTRMGSAEGSDIPKVMFKLLGRAMIDYVVNNLKTASVDDIVLVVGYKKEMVKDEVGDKVKYAVQEEQLGTGHAVLMAREILQGKSDAVLVYYGDMPLFKVETIKKLIQIYNQEKPTIAMLTVRFSNPKFWAFGRVIRDQEGKIIANVEQKDCAKEQLKIKECNPSFYIFDSDWLWQNFDKLSTNNAQGEYYLTDFIEIAYKQGEKIISSEVSEPEEVLGINTIEQLKKAEQVLIKRK